MAFNRVLQGRAGEGSLRRSWVGNIEIPVRMGFVLSLIFTPSTPSAESILEAQSSVEA